MSLFTEIILTNFIIMISAILTDQILFNHWLERPGFIAWALKVYTRLTLLSMLAWLLYLAVM